MTFCQPLAHKPYRHKQPFYLEGSIADFGRKIKITLHKNCQYIVEKTAKPKRKAKWSDSPLFWQSEYEFVTPYDFEECIRRLNALRIKYWDEHSEVWRLFFPQPEFGIHSQEDNGGVFNFKMSGSQSKVILDAELRGQLCFQNEHSTRVKVIVGFTKSSLFWLIAILFMFFITSYITIGLNIGNVVMTTIIIGLFLLIQTAYGYSLKGQLYYDLHEALTPAEVPRPQILPP